MKQKRNATPNGHDAADACHACAVGVGAVAECGVARLPRHERWHCSSQVHAAMVSQTPDFDDARAAVWDALLLLLLLLLLLPAHRRPPPWSSAMGAEGHGDGTVGAGDGAVECPGVTCAGVGHAGAQPVGSAWSQRRRRWCGCWCYCRRPHHHHHRHRHRHCHHHHQAQRLWAWKWEGKKCRACDEATEQVPKARQRAPHLQQRCSDGRACVVRP